MKKIIFIVFLILFLKGYCQKMEVNYETTWEAGFSTKDNTPFWVYNNQPAPAPIGKNGFGLIIGKLNADYFKHDDRKIDLTWGFDFQGDIGKDADVYIRQLYGGIKWQKIQLLVGMKKDAIAYDALSSTNGNFIYSDIARPYPRLSISLPEYVDVPLTKGWLAFKFLYSDGLLRDNRYVDNTRLHYKNAYVKLGGTRKWNIEFGMYHYVQWAGKSRDKRIDKLPKGFQVYKDVVLSKEDSKYDVLGDNIDFNHVGNHLGMFDMRFSYNGSKFLIKAYRQVIFEDASGRNLFNRDALTGLFVKFKKEKSWIQSALYEFYTTKYQSGKTPGGSPKPEGGIYTGRDNYFNHTIYRSGWTNHQRTIGTPFFTPIVIDDISLGISNNRIRAYHVGLSGYLMNRLPYRTLLSFSQNYGTYSKPHDNNQISCLLEMEIPQQKLPFKIIAGIAVDQGTYFNDTFGIFFRLSKSGIIQWN